MQATAVPVDTPSVRVPTLTTSSATTTTVSAPAGAAGSTARPLARRIVTWSMCTWLRPPRRTRGRSPRSGGAWPAGARGTSSRRARPRCTAMGLRIVVPWASIGGSTPIAWVSVVPVIVIVRVPHGKQDQGRHVDPRPDVHRRRRGLGLHGLFRFVRRRFGVRGCLLATGPRRKSALAYWLPRSEWKMSPAPGCRAHPCVSPSAARWGGPIRNPPRVAVTSLSGGRPGTSAVESIRGGAQGCPG